MNDKMLQRYLETSVYTDVGAYRDFVLSLPDDIASIGMLVCDQITHPSMYFTKVSPYLEENYYGKFSSYPKHRFKNEDELYITAVAMIAGILRLDSAGFTKNRDVTKRITVSCRQASVLFSAILKAKGIPCRSRAGFMDFHALMNNEIFYSYQPLYLRGGIRNLGEEELCEIDGLAELLSEPDENRERIERLWQDNEKFSILTNNTQNIYDDTFRQL